MFNQFSSLRSGRGDAVGSDSEGEGPSQNSVWGRGPSQYNRGSVEADSDFGTPQPQLGPLATASQWTVNLSPATAQNTQWQGTSSVSEAIPQVDPIPVVDRPLQPPKPKRTRVKGGRKNANANQNEDTAGQAASNTTQPIVPPSLVPATPQSHPKHRRQPDDPSAGTQSQYLELSMPVASSSSSQKKYPTNLSRTQSSTRDPSQASSRTSNQSRAVDYSLLNEEDGLGTQPDFFHAPPTPSQAPDTSSVSRKRPSPLPLDTTPSAPGQRNSASSSQRRAPTAPSNHPSTQDMRPPASPIRPEGKRRLVTVLIEDKRSDGKELAEIRVPLQQRGDTLWVKAAHVVENLQSGPSRIDGPCKVHAMRGHFRQSFLRIEHDGREVYDEQQSLQIVDEGQGKILNIFVETIPLPLASAPVYRGVSHEPSALQLDTNQSSHLPLTPRSTGPSPLLAQQPMQQKRKRLASARDVSVAPENAVSDYNMDYGHYEDHTSELQQTYESSLPSSSRKRMKSSAQPHETIPSTTQTSTYSGPSQTERAHSELRIMKAVQPTSGRSSQPTPSANAGYESDAFNAPSSQPSVVQQPHRPTPAYRQSSLDLEAPPTISGSVKMAKSSGHSLGIGLPSARMPARVPQTQTMSSAHAPVPEVVDISSRESSPERDQGSVASPLFSQASPPVVDAHEHASPTFSPAPFEPPQPHEDDHLVPSPAPRPAEREPEPPAAPSPPPVDPAIAKLLPLDIPPTAYVASEMPEFTDHIDQQMAARLTNTLRMDGFGFKDFQEKLTAGQALSNERALHWYRWVQQKVEKYANGSATAPAECERRLYQPKHVLAAMQVTEGWYEIVRETLSMMMAYGPGGKYGADPRVIKAASDKKPGDARLGVVRWTHLLLLLREVHEEWSRSQNTPRK